MRCDLPQFQRCCLCLPLRYGLITWGYAKLILDVIMIVTSSFELDDMLSKLSTSNRFGSFDIVFTSVLLLVLITDVALTTVFVIGGHKRNIRLLRVFYYYSQVIWVLLVLFIAVTIGFSMNSAIRRSTLRRWMWFLVDCSILIGNIALQFYLLLLLRSEISKLDSNCEFRFVNNTADAECTLTPKDDETNGENGIEAAYRNTEDVIPAMDCP